MIDTFPIACSAIMKSVNLSIARSALQNFADCKERFVKLVDCKARYKNLSIARSAM